jgi:hypothetical protein
MTVNETSHLRREELERQFLCHDMSRCSNIYMECWQVRRGLLQMLPGDQICQDTDCYPA